MKWDDKKGDKKVERLRKIAKEAAEQCHRTLFLKSKLLLLSSNCLQLQAIMMSVFLRMKKMQKVKIRNKIAERLKNVYHKQTVLVVFGPEGGLSGRSGALRTAGFLPMSLGPRILRTETAPLYLLSAMSYEFE